MIINLDKEYQELVKIWGGLPQSEEAAKKVLKSIITKAYREKGRQAGQALVKKRGKEYMRQLVINRWKKQKNK